MVVKNISFEGEELVQAGRVRRAFGLRGQLTVDWNNGSSPVPVGSGNIYLQATEAEEVDKLAIVKDHSHGDCNIITLKELKSRNDAEKYRGSVVWVERDKLPKLKKDEYYSYQLIDMKVETTQGEYLGDIKEIFSTGSNDVYVVKKGAKEILIPAIKDVVKKVSVEDGVMVIELIEGLV